MKNIEIDQDMVVPAPVHKLETNKYGTVPDLDDEELADPDELERQVLQEEYAPILSLPVKTKRNWLLPAVDENNGFDYGAFGTIDFERISPQMDKARYKADNLKEKLGDVLILFSIVSERIQGKAKYLVLKYLRMGIIDIDHIAHEDMMELGKLYLQARHIQREIAALHESIRCRSEKRLKAFLES